MVTFPLKIKTGFRFSLPSMVSKILKGRAPATPARSKVVQAPILARAGLTLLALKSILLCPFIHLYCYYFWFILLKENQNVLLYILLLPFHLWKLNLQTIFDNMRKYLRSALELCPPDLFSRKAPSNASRVCDAVLKRSPDSLTPEISLISFWTAQGKKCGFLTRTVPSLSRRVCKCTAVRTFFAESYSRSTFERG